MLGRVPSGPPVNLPRVGASRAVLEYGWASSPIVAGNPKTGWLSLLILVGTQCDPNGAKSGGKSESWKGRNF